MRKTKINNLGKGVIEYEIKALYNLKKSPNVLTNKQSPMEIKTNSDVVQIIQIYKDGSFLTFSPKS